MLVQHVPTGNPRGFPVGTCWTSKVDPYEGVSYVGRSVKELAKLEPEAVVHLLHRKHLPSDEELAAFKADLQARSKVDPDPPSNGPGGPP